MSKLFVGNLPWRARVSDLEQFLEGIGVANFEKAEVVVDRETGRSRGFGFVHFSTEALAADALDKIDGATMDSRVLRADRATERQRERDQLRRMEQADRRDRGGDRRRHRDEEGDVWE